MWEMGPAFVANLKVFKNLVWPWCTYWAVSLSKVIDQVSSEIVLSQEGGIKEKTKNKIILCQEPYYPGITLALISVIRK